MLLPAILLPATVLLSAILIDFGQEGIHPGPQTETCTFDLKSIAFTVLFLVFDVIEEVVLGTPKEKTIAESIPPIGGSPIRLLYIIIIISVALIPFFAFRDIGQVIGQQYLRKILFTKDYSWG